MLSQVSGALRRDIPGHLPLPRRTLPYRGPRNHLRTPATASAPAPSRSSVLGRGTSPLPPVLCAHGQREKPHAQSWAARFVTKSRSNVFGNLKRRVQITQTIHVRPTPRVPRTTELRLCPGGGRLSRARQFLTLNGVGAAGSRSRDLKRDASQRGRCLRDAGNGLFLGRQSGRCRGPRTATRPRGTGNPPATRRTQGGPGGRREGESLCR